MIGPDHRSIEMYTSVRDTACDVRRRSGVCSRRAARLGRLAGVDGAPVAA